MVYFFHFALVTKLTFTRCFRAAGYRAVFFTFLLSVIGNGLWANFFGTIYVVCLAIAPTPDFQARALVIVSHNFSIRLMWIQWSFWTFQAVHCFLWYTSNWIIHQINGTVSRVFMRLQHEENFCTVLNCFIRSSIRKQEIETNTKASLKSFSILFYHIAGCIESNSFERGFHLSFQGHFYSVR